MVLLLLLALSLVPASAAQFEFIYVGPPDSAAWNGVELGIEEANVQGEFLGTKFTLSRYQRGAETAAALAVFSGRAANIPNVSEQAGDRTVFNLAGSDDALREACSSNVLHVIPSAKMKADAVAQWKKKEADADVSAAAWHSAAVKFSARDLNKRFMKKYGEPMHEEAWAGWFAARAAADTLMRNPEASAAELLTLLKQEEFDGQKGDPHSFRANGQLRQPLVIISPAGELLGEAPVRGVATDLDSLGSNSCQ